MTTELENLSNNYVVQSRSNFQLKHFVIGQHDTPEMQYRQILIEAQDLLYKIKMAEFDLEKKKIRLEKLAKSDSKISAVKAKEVQLAIEYTLLTLEGAKRELFYLEELFKQYPKYTLDDIEDNQREYWEKRLSRQADLDTFSAQKGISVGNAQSMLDIGLIENKKELE